MSSFNRYDRAENMVDKTKQGTVSWWTDAARAGFTDLAQSKVRPAESVMSGKKQWPKTARDGVSY